jgi:hypothetical protein
MDDVARMAATDRADLFTTAASRRRLTPEIIEKDFWVCWTLRRLFTMPNLPAGLLFKGALPFPRFTQPSSASPRTWTCPSTGRDWASAARTIRSG